MSEKKGYEYSIRAFAKLTGKCDNINYLIAFGIGAVLGAFTISRLISFLFNKDKCKTLYFLLGLVIGVLVASFAFGGKRV